MKRILLFFTLILLISKIVVLPGCANIIPPTGGDRDSLPPLLLKVTPPDSTKGFNTKKITFTFDEYIDQPQDIFKNLMVSPNYSTIPGVETKLRTLTVTLKDTLEPNTTYYLNFGDAIKDFNEGNVLHNFSYIFTTGDTFDTLQLSGKVVLAETGGIDSTLVVLLFKNGADSAVQNDRARYITKLDGKGNFRFLYLPEGTYYIYVMDERKMYSEKSLFAFSDSAIQVKPDAAPVTLYAFREEKEQQSPAGSLINFTGGNRPGAKPDERRLKFSFYGYSFYHHISNISFNSDYLIETRDAVVIVITQYFLSIFKTAVKLFFGKTFTVAMQIPFEICNKSFFCWELFFTSLLHFSE